MSKKVIAILSVLKPVDDTRNFEKIARSIGNTNKYDINIIGFSTKNICQHPNISFYPLFSFRRMSIKRLSAPITIFRKIIKLKPELIIVTCAELLAVIYLYKILFGCKIIYDIQENYYRNIIFTNVYPALIKYPLALSIRLIEQLGRPFINQYFLAEKIYAEQLSFTKGKSLILENKAVIPESIQMIWPKKNDTITFVYSGTIAEHYGIFEAIEFIKKIHAINQNVEFSIIGFAPDLRIYKKITTQTKDYSFIKIIGGDKLVPHDQVINEMLIANFCLLPYQTNRSTAGRIPTKLYECLVLEIPVIISSNDVWNDLVSINNAGVIHDFSGTHIPENIFKKVNYYGNNLSSNYLWKNEETKLVNTIEKLF